MRLRHEQTTSLTSIDDAIRLLGKKIAVPTYSIPYLEMYAFRHPMRASMDICSGTTTRKLHLCGTEHSMHPDDYTLIDEFLTTINRGDVLLVEQGGKSRHPVIDSTIHDLTARQQKYPGALRDIHHGGELRYASEKSGALGAIIHNMDAEDNPRAIPYLVSKVGLKTAIQHVSSRSYFTPTAQARKYIYDQFVRAGVSCSSEDVEQYALRERKFCMKEFNKFSPIRDEYMTLRISEELQRGDVHAIAHSGHIYGFMKHLRRRHHITNFVGKAIPLLEDDQQDLHTPPESRLLYHTDQGANRVKKAYALFNKILSKIT